MMRSLQDDYEDVEVIRPSPDVSLPRNSEIKPPAHPLTFERVWNYRLLHSFELRHLVMVLLVLYLTFRVIKFFHWKILNNIVTNLGRETLEVRNGRIFQFKDEIKHMDIPRILKMDVYQLRKSLIEGEFSSLDLVNLFSDRCYIIGRGLNLTTQENFRSA
jgi:hypothetical protein